MKRSFGPHTIAYPLPVFLIGTYNSANKPDAMVVSWGGICSSEPPCIAISVRPTRQTYKNLIAKKEFTVSIPSVELMSRTDTFGLASGTDTDKFVWTGLTPVKAEKVDAPFVGECPVVLECRVSQVVEIGTHRQFIGEILDVKVDEKVLDNEGKPNLSKINPLIFDVIRSEYFSCGKVVGKAFSAGNKHLS